MHHLSNSVTEDQIVTILPTYSNTEVLSSDNNNTVVSANKDDVLLIEDDSNTFRNERNVAKKKVFIIGDDYERKTASNLYTNCGSGHIVKVVVFEILHSLIYVKIFLIEMYILMKNLMYIYVQSK